MCNLSEGIFEEGYKIGYEKGYKIGYEEGYREGYKEGYKIGYEEVYKEECEKVNVKSTLAVMKNKNVSANTAMDMLDIPAEERGKVLEALDKMKND